MPIRTIDNTVSPTNIFIGPFNLGSYKKTEDGYTITSSHPGVEPIHNIKTEREAIALLSNPAINLAAAQAGREGYQIIYEHPEDLA